MMRRNLFAFMFVASCASLAAVAASAQDFSRTYAIPAGGSIRITSVSGYVRVTGYSGNNIVVAGIKEGRDPGCVQIEDRSDSNGVELHARYPQSGSCNASVNFEVQVPGGLDYNFERLASVSGGVEVNSVKGRLRAESVSGSVTIRNVVGIVSASSVSGNVEVEINRLQGAGDMRFSSVSGSVNVKAPANLDADIEMSSISGSLKTNFSIDVQEQRYGPGRSARGRVGSGQHNLRITTVSGRVGLMHD